VARAAAELGPANVTYGVASAYALPFAERSFDVVHAHQVLQHLADPVAALREMYRVVRPGGLVAVRDADYAGFVWAPRDAVLERWMALYHDVTRRNGGEADAGRYLLRWARAAGFTDLRMTSSTWTFADPEARAWWGGLWADRVRYSELATQARAYGLAQPDDLAEMAEAFLRWAGSEDATFIVPHGEVIGVRPADERRPPGAPYSLPNS
jgi:SAM-dependent methyltransferase